MTTRAIWKGRTIAASDDVVVVEGNAYFPRDALDPGCVRPSAEAPTYCHWKGTADYLDIVVGDDVNAGAAWFYREPYPEAAAIRDRVAFWRGVAVEGQPAGDRCEQRPSLRNGKTGWQALCWLLSKTGRETGRERLDAAEILEATGLGPAEVARLWPEYDVQRYARRYRWSLVGDGPALRLERH